MSSDDEAECPGWPCARSGVILNEPASTSRDIFSIKRAICPEELKKTCREASVSVKPSHG